MEEVILDALDELGSSRTSKYNRALNILERLVAECCTGSNNLSLFLKLQDTFECNIASRLALSLSYTLPSARRTFESSTSESVEQQTMLDAVIQPILQTLNILQGLSLIHPRSKAHLGRKPTIQTLLEILSISRHISNPIQATNNLPPRSPASFSASSSSSYNSNTSFVSTSSTSSSLGSLVSPPLASASLDTLLCILVDSPVSIRAFEDVNGVESIVKTLKRTGIAKDVRIRCLEFLYFYLLPEDGTPLSRIPSTSVSENLGTEVSRPMEHEIAKATASPPLAHSPSIFLTESDNDVTPVSSPTKRRDRNLVSSPTKATLHPPAPLSRVSSSSTPISSSPKKHVSSSRKLEKSSDSSSAAVPASDAKTSQLAMLRREVDFFPQSPDPKAKAKKQAQVAGLGILPGGKPRLPMSRSRTPIFGDGDSETDHTPGASPIHRLYEISSRSRSPSKEMRHSSTFSSTSAVRVNGGSDAPPLPPFPNTIDRSNNSAAPPSSTRSKQCSSSDAEPSPRSPAKGNSKGLPPSLLPSSSSPFLPPSSPMKKSKPTPLQLPSNPSIIRVPSSPTRLTLSPGPNSPTRPYLGLGTNDGRRNQPSNIRTTAEKKELLSTWLGNVDALVEGVQKAGVWGLA